MPDKLVTIIVYSSLEAGSGPRGHSGAVPPPNDCLCPLPQTIILPPQRGLCPKEINGLGATGVQFEA